MPRCLLPAQRRLHEDRWWLWIWKLAILQGPSSETTSSVQYAQEVEGVVVAAVRGAKAVQGGEIFVECVDGGDLFSVLQRPAKSDMRTLPLELNALGQPERTLKEVAAACQEKKSSGCWSAKWCVNYLGVENLGLEGHRERVRQITKADASLWGMQEHFQVSVALRQALLIDQLDHWMHSIQFVDN